MLYTLDPWRHLPSDWPVCCLKRRFKPLAHSLPSCLHAHPAPGAAHIVIMRPCPRRPQNVFVAYRGTSAHNCTLTCATDLFVHLHSIGAKQHEHPRSRLRNPVPPRHRRPPTRPRRRHRRLRLEEVCAGRSAPLRRRMDSPRRHDAGSRRSPRLRRHCCR